MSSLSFAGDQLSETLKQFAGQYQLESSKTHKKYECRSHFTIGAYSTLSGGLKLKKKSRHQQYVRGSVSRPGQNTSTNPAVLSYKSVKKTSKFPFGKQTNVIFTKFDSRVSDYGQLTYISNGTWGNYFEGYKSEKVSLTIDFNNQGLSVGFYTLANKKKGKLGKKLATCNYIK